MSSGLFENKVTYKLFAKLSPHSIMTKVVDCDLKVNEFNLQSLTMMFIFTLYIIPLGKGMDFLIPLLLWVESYHED